MIASFVFPIFFLAMVFGFIGLSKVLPNGEENSK